jgi:hypothetical protein
MTLEPSGMHGTATGMIRYAIWHWTDADGLRTVPCGVIAALAATRIPKSATCGGTRPLLKANSRSLRRVAALNGVVDDDYRLTERGAAMRLMFLRRAGVLAGYETAHGEVAPF